MTLTIQILSWNNNVADLSGLYIYIYIHSKRKITFEVSVHIHFFQKTKDEHLSTLTFAKLYIRSRQGKLVILIHMCKCYSFILRCFQYLNYLTLKCHQIGKCKSLNCSTVYLLTKKNQLQTRRFVDFVMICIFISPFKLFGFLVLRH